MKPVYINGMGISGANEKVQELVPRMKLRRCPEYVKIASLTAAQAIYEAHLPADADKNKTGSVLATNFGPIESNISFTDQIYNEGPSLCSPTVFSFTVANSCGGQIAILNGFRGPSTMLMGSNPFEYAQLLLNLDKAEYLLTGCVEECNAELVAGLKNCGQLQEVATEPTSVMFMLSCNKSEDSYAALEKTSVTALSTSPFTGSCKAEDSQAIAELMQELMGEAKPDLVFAAANGTSFDAIELAGIKAALGEVAILQPKQDWGETLGCGFALNVALAARMLKNETAKTVVATGIDAAGNYIAALLAKV